MNQPSSETKEYSLLCHAKRLLESAKQQARRQSVTVNINEIWGILNVLSLRPAAIQSSAAELRQLLITGHLAEARRIFLNAPAETATDEEKNAAFKAMCENVAAAMRMPPPPPPSLSAPPVTTETTCAVLAMNDPFQNPPNDAAKIIGATAVDEFENDGVEPTEISVSEMQTVDDLNRAANDCALRDSAPQTLESPRDQALVERFFGGKEEAEKFGFIPTPKPMNTVSSEAILAEMSSVPPPHSDEVVCADKVQEGAMVPSRDRSTFEAASDIAS